MKATKVFGFVFSIVGFVGCAYQAPVFQDTGGKEEAHEIPCSNGKGGFYTISHRCHRPDPQGKVNAENGIYNCCVDGYSCGEDDFFPSQEHVCRWRGNNGTY